MPDRVAMNSRDLGRVRNEDLDAVSIFHMQEVAPARECSDRTGLGIASYSSRIPSRKLCWALDDPHLPGVSITLEKWGHYPK